MPPHALLRRRRVGVYSLGFVFALAAAGVQLSQVSILIGEPAPPAFFKGFGDSSLDFVARAWTDQGYEQALPLTSRLGLAVHRKLREAGIEIPFPQRVLHLASVSPAARGMLAGGERPDRGSGDTPRSEPMSMLERPLDELGAGR